MRLKTDRWLILLVFLLSGAFASCQVGWKAAQGQFYQAHYAPAVMLACEGVFARPQAYSPPLLEYLRVSRENLKCEDIGSTGVLKPTPFQSAHLYLMGAVAGLWALFGVAWGNLMPLYVLLYAASVTAAFCFFRLGLSRPLSVALTAVFALSALHLAQLPHLRDYAKAPFILWTLWVIGWLLTRMTAPRHLVAISGAVGAFIGIGIGFRMDVALMLPPYLVALFFIRKTDNSLDVMANRFIAALACVVLFAITSYPIVSALNGASNVFHVMLLGLMSPFDQALGVQSAIYEFGGLYNDEYAADVVAAFANRFGAAAGHFVTLSTKEYDQASATYYFHLAANFPADMLVRYYAAVLRLLGSVQAPDLLANAPLMLAEVLNALAYFLPWLALAVVSCISMSNIPLAVFAVGVVLYLAGYPSLQFHPRHYFHLQVGVLMVVGLSLQNVARWLRDRFGSRIVALRPTLPASSGSWRRPPLFAAACIASAISILLLARLWQQPHLIALFTEQSQVRTTPVATTPIASGGAVLFPLPTSTSTAALRANYWAFDFDGRRCEKDSLVMKAKYAGKATAPVFGSDIAVRIFPKSTYMMASYSRAGREFAAVELPEEDANCLVRIRRADDLKPSALALSVNLVDGWQDQPLYQRLAAWEAADSVPRQTPEFVVIAQDHKVKRATILPALATLPIAVSGSTAFRSDAVQPVSEGLQLSGPVASSYSYFLQLPEKTLTTPGYFLVEGTVLSGGITAGLIQNGKWLVQANVTTPGPFVVAIEAKPGTYLPTLANNVPNLRKNDLLIRKAGWVDLQALHTAPP